VGPFPIAEAVALADLAPERLLPPAEALRGRPRVEVGDDVAALVAHGRVLDRTDLGLAGDDPGPWAVLDGAGRLLAVYEPHRGPTVKPGVVLSG
jgi:tRNA pseudouridine55 synthase